MDTVVGEVPTENLAKRDDYDSNNPDPGLAYLSNPELTMAITEYLVQNNLDDFPEDFWSKKSGLEKFRDFFTDFGKFIVRAMPWNWD